MKAVLKNINDFKNLIDVLSSFFHEVKFKIGEEGLKLRAIDAANICLVDLHLTKEFFDEINGSSEFNIKIDNLKDILKKAKKGDTLTLELNPQTGKLKIELKGSTKRKYYLPLITEETDEIPEPELTFKNNITIDTKTFKEIIENIDAVADNTIIESNESKFLFKGLDDLSEVVVELDKNNENVLEFKVEEEAKAMYGNDYLKKIAKLKITPFVKLEFSNEYPLQLTFKDDYKNVKFVIAPKLE